MVPVSADTSPQKQHTFFCRTNTLFTIKPCLGVFIAPCLRPPHAAAASSLRSLPPGPARAGSSSPHPGALPESFSTPSPPPTQHRGPGDRPNPNQVRGQAQPQAPSCFHWPGSALWGHGEVGRWGGQGRLLHPGIPAAELRTSLRQTRLSELLVLARDSARCQPENPHPLPEDPHSHYNPGSRLSQSQRNEERGEVPPADWFRAGTTLRWGGRPATRNALPQAAQPYCSFFSCGAFAFQ